MFATYLSWDELYPTHAQELKNSPQALLLFINVCKCFSMIIVVSRMLDGC